MNEQQIEYVDQDDPDTEEQNTMAEAIKAFRLVAIGTAAFLAYEAVIPPAGSVIVNVMEKWAEGEAAGYAAVVREQEKLEHDVKIAVSQALAYQQAYTGIYGMYTSLASQAYQVELQMISVQQAKIGGTQWVDTVGANIASAVCMLGSGLNENDDPLTIEACAARENIQNRMLADYPDLLAKHRSTLPEDLIGRLIKPDDILVPEFERLRKIYGPDAP